MTDIKKLTKIAILAYGAVSLIFGILLFFFTEMFIASLNMPTWQNPAHPRMFGAALFIVVIFAFLVLLKKDLEWENIHVAFLVLISWLPLNILAELVTLATYGPILSFQAFSQGIMDIIIMSALFVLNLIAYIKQRA
jgi:hypothetical protein